MPPGDRWAPKPAAKPGGDTRKQHKTKRTPQTDSSHLCIVGEEERLGRGGCAGTQKAKASTKAPPGAVPQPQPSPPASFPRRGYFILFSQLLSRGCNQLQPNPPPRRGWHQPGSLLQILTVTMPRSRGRCRRPPPAAWRMRKIILKYSWRGGGLQTVPPGS